MAVRMEYSGHFVSVNLIDLTLNFLNKSRTFNYRVNSDLSLRFRDVVEVDSDDTLHPFFELQHFLARKLIPASCDLH